MQGARTVASVGCCVFAPSSVNISLYFPFGRKGKNLPRFKSRQLSLRACSGSLKRLLALLGASLIKPRSVNEDNLLHLGRFSLPHTLLQLWGSCACATRKSNVPK